MTASIPLWVPLVVAIFGLIGTAGGAIAGVVITQRSADARDKTAWEREREREHERWAREDAARTFELRREAYIEFYKAVNWQRLDFELGQMFRDQSLESGKPHRPFISAEAYGAQGKVRLYGSSVVVETAEKVWTRLHRTIKTFDYEKSTEENIKALKLEEAELLSLIRTDLGIPGGAIDVADL